MKYAEVVVNRPVHMTFHYHLSPELEPILQAGHLVQIAFGTSMLPAVVIAFHDTSPVESTKPIIDILDPEPIVSLAQIELAHWLSQTYFAPIGQCIWLMIPPGITGQRDMIVHLLDEKAIGADSLQAQIIDLLKRRGALRGEQIQRSTKSKTWQQAINALKKAGIVQTQSMLAPPRVKPKRIQVAALNIHPEHIPELTPHLGKPNRESILLEKIVAMIDEHDGQLPAILDVLAIPHIGETTLNNLIEAGGIRLVDGTFAQPVQSFEQVLFTLKKGEIDQRILRVLARENKAVDVSWVYAQANASMDDLKRLAERGLIKLGEKRAWRDSLAERDFIPIAAPKLSSEQQTVWKTIREALNQDESGTFLLHGVTGSGKTEIYLRAIEHVINQGQQALFLVPEIALTAQTIRRVMARFPGQVAVVGADEADDNDQPGQIGLIHSRLSPGERYDTWQRAKMGQIQVIIGTRSALFTPFPEAGLIILDEEHDASYKQSPPARNTRVYYHTREVAQQMMQAQGGVLILGSATPSLETAFRAQQGSITYLQLPQRIMGHRVRIAEQAERTGISPLYNPGDSKHLTDAQAASVTGNAGQVSDAVYIPLPEVRVVDMRTELKAGNTDMFSRDLQQALEFTLKKGEQAILFLNRRGTATYVFCRDCGYIATCPRCNTPLTHHQYNTALHCHHCGYSTPSPETCPACTSNRIRFFGAGTQQVEATLAKHFPQAQGIRWDMDTTPTPDEHDAILHRFMERQADVLIGTQMVAKGLDLPFVTLVGVISADVGLNLPDFRAAERTFQLLTQVAGRAGRGLRGGQVILQTYQPQHYAIQAAATHNYAGFYEQEIGYRREMGYPPYRHLVRILIRTDNAAKAQAEANQAAAMLKARLEADTTLIGPVPCFYEKVNRVYRWQVILRGPNPISYLHDLQLPANWFVDVDPIDLL